MRQEEARRLAPVLSPHIPRITYYYHDEPMSAILMTVAGGGLLETEVMAKVNGALLNAAAQKISTSLLSEWNRTSHADATQISADAVLREWLEHRLSSSGRIPDVLRSVLNIPDDMPAFRYGGVDYPNPYGFAAPGFAGNQVILSVCRGLIHGDLHSENILLSGARTIENYFFIDFAFFKPDAPLFFDHAYPELHLLLSRREAATHRKWQEPVSAQPGTRRDWPRRVLRMAA